MNKLVPRHRGLVASKEKKEREREREREKRVMKIVFLDIDGVLNSVDWYIRRKAMEEQLGAMPRRHREIDPAAVERLNRLLEATGAEVVISSTWRRLHSLREIEEYLRACGYHGPRLLDDTPVLCTLRGLEIQDWLDHARDDITPDDIVILDDDSDMEHLEDRLVLTRHTTGLLDEHVERAIEMLRSS